MYSFLPGMSEEDSKEIMDILVEDEKAHQEDMKRNALIFGSADSDSMNITIKPEILDTSALEESTGEKEDFRPSNFEQYIGQESAKQRILS